MTLSDVSRILDDLGIPHEFKIAPVAIWRYSVWAAHMHQSSLDERDASKSESIFFRAKHCEQIVLEILRRRISGGAGPRLLPAPRVAATLILEDVAA